MADIELVIKIPEEIRLALINNIPLSSDQQSTCYGYIQQAIINGAPLPKGHGKIVDIDKLIDSKCNECGHIRGVSCTIPCYAVRRMLDAERIIEADKGEQV